MQSVVSITNEQEKAVNILVSSDSRQDQIKPEIVTLPPQTASSLSEDFVNLSPASLAEASASPDRKTSIAVSNEEKKALLTSSLSGKSFSVYG